MESLVFRLICAASLLGSSGVAAAQSPNRPSPRSDDVTQTAELAQFAPKANLTNTRIDYSAWDEALEYFVFFMGPSERRISYDFQPRLGSRIAFGHDSPLRMEGNRVGFSFLKDPQIEGLTAYRQELEALGGKIDIASLPRNEQLAYWLNLHNVAVIEQIALAYPVSQPSRIEISGHNGTLDTAKFLTVAGVPLSLSDIRQRIVYPHWRDPRVIYGFFRGEIGGPTIQRRAFNAQNVELLLQGSAIDFINSLRGVERRGKTLHISKMYDEAIPYFFAGNEAALRAHLRRYARGDLTQDIDRTRSIRTTIYEHDISDLAKGERAAEYGEVVQELDPKGYGYPYLEAPYRPIGVPYHIARLVEEKVDKLERMRKRGQLRGLVEVLDPETDKSYAPGREVE